MKLLLDNNLSSKLVAQLVNVFPETSHVALLGLEAASDADVWETARQGGYCLVSKDSDFNDLLSLKGSPPKVIWIRLGNCTTAAIANLLLSSHEEILAFGQDASVDLLVLE
jgi:predicted nuclease of predicted toxin-antitoxin system